MSPDSPMTSAFSLARGREDLLRGHHDAEVDHVEVVALEHDADDVLADVVHVALDRRHDDRALRRASVAGARLFGLDVRNQVRDGLLHHPRALDDLRQEHLAGAEQVADDVHAVHQRALDHLDRASAARGDCARASSVSSTTYVVMPLTSACDRRASTLASRHARSSSTFLPCAL